MHRSVRTRTRSTRPRLPAGNRLLAAVVLAAALINGLFALAIGPPSRFDINDPSTIVDERVWSTLVAAALVPLAWGILRRRRGAWLILVAVLVGVVGVDVVHGDEPSELLLPAIGLIGVLMACRRLVAEPFRETLRRHTLPTRKAMARTQELLEAHATDSMAPFKLREDVGHLFSAAGDAVLAFRVENRALLVAGDPIGTPAGVDEVIQQARRLARGAGLRFAVVAASEGLCDRTCERYDAPGSGAVVRRTTCERAVGRSSPHRRTAGRRGTPCSRRTAERCPRPAGPPRARGGGPIRRYRPRISTAIFATWVGVRPTCTPTASSASALACAVPAVPETIAPACPMVLPGGAVKPAM